jgi:hypothetical protein
LQVAGLRVAEIAIGVIVGLAISIVVPTARATARFNAECAKVLRMISAHVDRSLAQEPRSVADKEMTAAEMRKELRHLTMLADSADLELRLFRRKSIERRASGAERQHRRIAQLLTRLFQDASLPGRVFDTLQKQRADVVWQELRDGTCASLDACADLLSELEATRCPHPSPLPEGEGKWAAEFGTLNHVDAVLAQRRRTASSANEGDDEIATLLAAPLRLLLDDLRALAHITAAITRQSKPRASGNSA